MARICNFPIDGDRRCTQPMADGKPNCGRHKCEISADQLGQSPTMYEKNGEWHIWAGEPDNPYCLIHSDPAYRTTTCRLDGEVLPRRVSEATKYEYKRRQWRHKGGPVKAIENGSQVWRENGELHREDGPAIITPIGSQFWYWHGKRHRDDGPAAIVAYGWSGADEWYQYGKLHRDDGPAVIETGIDGRHGGTRKWYQYGKLHRDNGPAVIRADGIQEWYQHGELYRSDGPAVVEADNTGTQEWL